MRLRQIIEAHFPAKHYSGDRVRKKRKQEAKLSARENDTTRNEKVRLGCISELLSAIPNDIINITITMRRGLLRQTTRRSQMTVGDATLKFPHQLDETSWIMTASAWA